VQGLEAVDGTTSGREYPTRPIVGVAAVILVAAADRARLGIEPLGPEQGLVLVRRRFQPLAGEWSLPGGAVELGETLERAIIREAAEETGLMLEVGPIVEVFDRIVPDDSGRVQYHFVLIDFLCCAADGRLAPGSDVSEAVVVDPADLETYALTENARSVIARGLTLMTERGSTPSS